MAWFIVDKHDRVAQRVTEDASGVPPRFVKVQAEGVREAFQAAYSPACDACGSTRHVAPGQTLCESCRPGTLHERVARVLGWAPEQAQSFSLPALRDLVRPVSPKLAWEITCAIEGSVTR